MNHQQETRIRNRMSELSDKIEDELDYRNCGASDDLDYEMSNARLAGYNAEFEKLEKLL